MPSIDLVIVSDAKNAYLKSLTEQAIKTAGVNTIVVEKQDVQYEALTVKQVGAFGYNKFLNYGASFGSSEYIVFANNDIIFHPQWAENLIRAMEEHGAVSGSPYCGVSHRRDNLLTRQNSGVHEGYEVREHFAGYCFCWRRDFWEQNKLDERFVFWCSDNAAIEQVVLAQKKHIIVTDSIITHLDAGSKTLSLLPDSKKALYLHPEVRKFNRLYNKNFFRLGKGFEPGVTVIVPVYGEVEKWEPLYQRAIESAKRQTVQPKDIILSIENDITSARNKPAWTVNTEFIIFLDADDELDEYYIEKMLQKSADVNVPVVHRYSDKIDTDQYWYTPIDLMERNYIVIGAMIRTEVFQKVGGFRDFPALEDYDLWLRVEESGATFVQSEAIYKIHVQPKSRNSDQSSFEEIKSQAKKRRLCQQV